MSSQQRGGGGSEACALDPAARPGSLHLAAWPGGAHDATLASDADRNSAVHLLSEAFAEGRLTASEHGDRVQAAFNARTWAELNELTADLPAHASAIYARRTAGMVALPAHRCLLCAVLVLCPPVGIAWLLASRRRARETIDDRVGAVWPASAAARNGKHAEDR